ncbi:MAG TPA: cohesin domain-containing protein [Patescibacteria group bacterium]
MPNKTTILIIILFLITCGLLYLAITNTPVQKKETATNPTPTPISVNAKTTLTLTTASATESSRTADYTVAVVVDTTNKVNGVQLELSYDSQKITNVTLHPGTFFKEPNVLLNSVDANNGRISYALAEQVDLTGKTGKGTIATISFNLSHATKPNDTAKISFLPKTAVSADKILESVLESTQDITIPLPTGMPSAMPLQQATPSAK